MYFLLVNWDLTLRTSSPYWTLSQMEKEMPESQNLGFRMHFSPNLAKFDLIMHCKDKKAFNRRSGGKIRMILLVRW